MPRPTLLLKALPAVALGWVLLLALPAGAGGPTSVLVVSPATQTTASLYATSADYATLYRAVGGDEPAPEKGAPTTPVRPSGEQVNITWLAHDVAVWRTDAVVVGPDGEVWVHTRVGGLEAEGTWHRSPYPDELRDLLGRLGVRMPGVDGAVAGAAALNDSDGSVTGGAGPAGADDHSSGVPAPNTAWPWLLAAGVGGALLGAGGGRWLRGRPDEPARPRQELIDV